MLLQEISVFSGFKKLVQSRFAHLCQATHLFEVDVEKDELWDTYLASYPQEDGIAQGFNCNSCRQFIKNYGGLVAVVDGEMQSIWEVESPDPVYQKVADSLSSLVKSKSIRDGFVSVTTKLGSNCNGQVLEDGTLITWEHFFCSLPDHLLTKTHKSEDSVRGLVREKTQTFKRALEELTPDSVITVIELIDQDSLYRGAEFKGLLSSFATLQKGYLALPSQQLKDLFCWEKSAATGGAISGIRNTAIGSLLVDISKGMALDSAVNRFETVTMGAANYKRSKPIVTERMKQEAEAEVVRLGLGNSLERRFAVVDDVTVNNLLFVDRAARPKSASPFDLLDQDITVTPKSLSKVQEISLKEFLTKVVPTATSMEFLLETRLDSNLVSLIAPVDMDSPSLVKWNNGFSWSYQGAFADSVKEKVKAAGGKVEGLIRASLAWLNYDDLDLHCVEPKGFEIYYNQKRSKHGSLDVDMNAGSRRTRTPVENIIYPFDSAPDEGPYKVYVNQYCQRENIDVGFVLELEFNNDGNIFEFHHSGVAKGKICVAEFTYSRTEGFKVLTASSGLKSTTKKLWELSTNRFHRVNSVMYSPNYWDSQSTGNQHVFFMLEGATNSDPLVRGFFNEFLPEELKPHRKIFEALAARMKVESQPHDRQLSGVGFSLTKRDSFYVKVKGSFDRVVKVKV